MQAAQAWAGRVAPALPLLSRKQRRGVTMVTERGTLSAALKASGDSQ